MSKYEDLQTSKEFLALMKRLYSPSNKKVEEINVPKMKFIAVEGQGSPEAAAFQEAVRCLYGVAYGLKMGLKFGKLNRLVGYFDFKIPPLEGLWWAPGKFDMNKKDTWHWQLMIMVPAYVTQGLLDEAIAQVQAKRPAAAYCNVFLAEHEEGSAIQIMHIGPYSAEPQTIDKLMVYAKANAEKIAGRHHEVYLGDPRRSAPERLKTVIRYPISK